MIGIIVWILALIAIIVIYFLPTIIANQRWVINTAWVFIINLAFWWTFFWWILALIWGIIWKTN